MPSLKERAPRPVVHAIDAHPAFDAWRRFSGSEVAPDRIDAFQSEDAERKANKPLVFRLYGVDAGRPVIAKCSARETSAGEELIYRNVLPTLPVSSVRWLGRVDALGGGAQAWTFLEDAGDTHWLIENPTHRLVAASWMGRLHATGAQSPELATLPDTGPSHYHAHMDEARTNLGALLSRTDLPDDVRAALTDILAAFETIRGSWDDIRQLGPTLLTLVHGDFRQKNVRLKGPAEGQTLLAIDWEFAGRGSPAADLAECGLASDDNAAIAYCRSAAEHGWAVTLNDVRDLAFVGTIYRLLSSVLWESTSLGTEYRPRFGWRMLEYRDRLRLRARQVHEHRWRT